MAIEMGENFDEPSAAENSPRQSLYVSHMYRHYA